MHDSTQSCDRFNRENDENEGLFWVQIYWNSHPIFR